MNYLALRTTLLAILNRTDATDQLAQYWVQHALQRIQRECRLPHNERLLYLNTSAAQVTQFPVPPDWMETIMVFCQSPNGESTELAHVDIGTFMRLSPADVLAGPPMRYSRLYSNFVVAGPFPLNSTCGIYYYGPETPLVNNTDVTTLSDTFPDLIIYAALTYAADYFVDDRGTTWEQKFQLFRDQAQGQAAEGETETGASAVQPAVIFDDSVGIGIIY